MILTAKNIWAFEVEIHNMSNRRIAKSLKKLFSESLKDYNDQRLLELIAQRRVECEKLEIFTEKEILRYMSVEFILNPTFYRTPQFMGMFGKGLSGDQVMKVFFEKLQTV